MAPRREYSEERREEAVLLAAQDGLAGASRALDIPKSTIKTWAKERNVDVADVKLQAKVERATTMSVAVRRQRIAETKERATLLYAVILELGQHAQINLLKAGQYSLAEAIGATTRALHDLQLLEGKPTEITEEIDAAQLGRLRDELQARLEQENG